jgi:hypothetical protein
MLRAASSDQEKSSAPYPKGWLVSGRRRLPRRPLSSSSWLPVSASACRVSANSPAEPVRAAATALATDIARSVLMAIATVPKLSVPPVGAWCRRIATRFGPVVAFNTAMAHRNQARAPAEGAGGGRSGRSDVRAGGDGCGIRLS